MRFQDLMADPENLPLHSARQCSKTQVHSHKKGYCLKIIKGKTEELASGNEASSESEASKDGNDKKKGKKKKILEKQVCRFDFPKELAGFVAQYETAIGGQQFMSRVDREKLADDEEEDLAENPHHVKLPFGAYIDLKTKRLVYLRNHR